MLRKNARLSYFFLAVVGLSVLASYAHRATAVLDRALHGDRTVRVPVKFGVTLNRVSGFGPEALRKALRKHDDMTLVVCVFSQRRFARRSDVKNEQRQVQTQIPFGNDKGGMTLLPSASPLR